MECSQLLNTSHYYMKPLGTVASKAIIRKIEERHGIPLIYHGVDVPNFTGHQSGQVVTYNIDHVISYLYVTTNNTKNQCIHIEAKGVDSSCSEVYLRFKDEAHRGTLFTGYLIDMRFYVLDMLVHNGVTLSKTFYDRISLCNQTLDYSYKHDPILCDIRVSIIPYTEYRHAISFWAQRPCRSKITGLLFTNANGIRSRVIIADDISQVGSTSKGSGNANASKVSGDAMASKGVLREPRKGKACFRVKATSTSDVYELYLDGLDRVYDTAGIQDSETSLMMRKLHIPRDGYCMLCQYNPKFKRWIPLMVSNQPRPDHINSI